MFRLSNLLGNQFIPHRKLLIFLDRQSSWDSVRTAQKSIDMFRLSNLLGTQFVPHRKLLIFLDRRIFLGLGSNGTENC